MRSHSVIVSSLLVLASAVASPGVAQAPGEAKPHPQSGQSGPKAAPQTTPDDRGRLTGALNDLWLTAVAKTRLMRNEEVSALDVDVDAHDGVVTLFGMVPTVSSHAAAELEITKMDGVRRVENLLEVVPEPIREATRRHDRALEREVRARLDAREEIARPDLEVSVCNGVARLRGSLESPEQRRAALETVRETAGVREVVDQLQVDGTPAREHASPS